MTCWPQDLFVPGYRTLGWEKLAAPDNPGSSPPGTPDPRTHGTLLTNLVAPSVALGAAESAVDLLRDRLQAGGGKNPVGRQETRRWRRHALPGPPGWWRRRNSTGRQGSPPLRPRCSRSPVAAGSGLPDGDRAAFRLSLALSAEAAQEAVRVVLAGSGGSAHRLGHPLRPNA